MDLITVTREEGLRFTVFDKGSFATTIQGYPRKKMVMAEPAHIPIHGSLWLRDTTKEELISKWEEIIAETRLEIRSGEEVTGADKGEDGIFTVRTASGAYRSRNVILAVGTRGSPRKLGAGGETPERVEYVLTDPDAYANQCLLVVGGGDSAVEAAMSLADVPGTTVTLSYRRDAFGRIKARNKSRIEEYAGDGRIDLILSSTVSAIKPRTVVLKTAQGDKRIKNDVVFALLGAEPPTKLFESAGIRIVQPGTPEMEKLAASRGMRRHASKCDHCAGHPDQACLNACPTGAMAEIHPAELFVDVDADAGGRVFSDAPFTLGLDRILGRRRGRLWHIGVAAAAILSVATGAEVFLRTKAPELSGTALLYGALGWARPLHFTPGRGLGLWLGIIGMSMMVLTALYPLQSRLYWFSWLARTRVWMSMHIWAGILGPLFVTYHTTLKLDRWPSIAFWLAWVVALTGATGRYLSTTFKRSLSLSDLEMQSLEHERERLFQKWSGVDGRTGLFRTLAKQAQPRSIPVLLAPILMLWNQLTSAVHLAYVRYVALPSIEDKQLRKATLLNYQESLKAVRRRMFAESLSRSVTLWQRLHLGLTVVMLVVAILHVIIGLLYKAT
jgi:thioredoxin reductase